MWWCSRQGKHTLAQVAVTNTLADLYRAWRDTVGQATVAFWSEFLWYLSKLYILINLLRSITGFYPRSCFVFCTIDPTLSENFLTVGHYLQGEMALKCYSIHNLFSMKHLNPVALIYSCAKFLLNSLESCGCSQLEFMSTTMDSNGDKFSQPKKVLKCQRKLLKPHMQCNLLLHCPHIYSVSPKYFSC